MDKIIKYNPVALGFALAVPTLLTILFVYFLGKDILRGGDFPFGGFLIGTSIILIFAVFSVSIWNESTVKIEENVISKNSLIGKKNIGLSDLLDVKKEYLAGVLWKIILRSENDKITINAYYYRDADRLVEFFASHELR
ncbi:MAG: hypothetical protein QM785_06500 [Pyrinomonadaceae bacterium]